MDARRRAFATLLLVTAVIGGAAAAQPQPAAAASSPAASHGRPWLWPLAGATLTRPFQAPAGPYAAGHRGIDMMPTTPGAVRAPAAGVVAFTGMVAGRPVVTIDHGAGVVTTLEPVASTLPAGHAVAAGAAVGAVGEGGHATPGSVHLGVRVNGRYVNPLLFLGGLPRAVLLPCCS